MLDQVIYTRSMPHRDLKKGGAVDKVDGFGVYSASKELLAPDAKVNIDLLLTMLVEKNCAKEDPSIGLISSYEFFGVSQEKHALVYEVPRPKGKIPRLNGAEHRSGNYVKQGLIGAFRGYPCEYFGADVWTACQVPENDYYHDKDATREPAWLPQVDDAPQRGSITMERIRTFVCDGRVEAVKAAVWYLIHEMEKPMAERKVLLIRDVPENVEQWVAAVSYAFSAQMARQLTFSTNRTKLGTQIESQLYYYADASGNYVRGAARGAQSIRTPYFMIVGYHPQDKYSTAKQMPTSNFVLLDGTTKTIGVTPDDSINRPYYNALIQYNDDISDFCQVVLPGLPVTEITSQLPDLFDAYKYLLDSDSKSQRWTYQNTVRHLEKLTRNGVPAHEALSEYLLNEFRKVYPRFAQEDEQNQFTLLKTMWKIAVYLHREQDVTDCVADRLAYPLSRLQSHGATLQGTWTAMKSAQINPLLQKALKELFEDSELRSYFVQFGKADTATVDTVVDMFLTVAGQDAAAMAAIPGNAEKYGFLYAAILALMEDRIRLSALIARIGRCTPLMNSLSLQVSNYLDNSKPNKSTMWWDLVIDASGGDISRLIQTLAATGKMDISLVERLLSNKITRSRGCSKAVLESFTDAVKKMGKTPDTGIRFFRAWLDVSEPGDISEIIRAVKKCGLHVNTEAALFRQIDGSLPYDKSSGVQPAVIADLKRWAGELGLVSRSAALTEFRRSFDRERKPEKAVELAVDFAELKYVIDADFISSEYFINLACCSAEFCDEELHLALLCMYVMPDAKLRSRFVTEYVRKVLNHAKGKLLVQELLSLVGASMHGYSFKGIPAAQVSDMQDVLERTLEKELPQYYKRSLADQVSRSQEGTPDVKKKLIAMLEDVAENLPQSGLESFLGGLFGKRKGK